MMGGSEAHEFMVLNPAGEDVLVLCETCDFSANRQVARVRRPTVPDAAPLPMAEVETPGATTIAALAAFLRIDPSETAKAAFFMTGDGRLVTAVVRGDREVNETKLVNAVKATGGMRPATVEEIRAAGMEPGYGSPIGATGTTVVVDELAARSPNLVAGANRVGWHVRNVNVGRDFTPDVVADIDNAQEGDACPTCGSPLILRNGIEVGNIFKLGTKYTDAFGARYLGEDGKEHPIVMGSYGIGLGRNVACIVERHHDDKGIVWPEEVAPYPAHLVSIGANKEPRVAGVAEELHDAAAAAGRELLWDDRDESPGVKFTDAELLGMPWIVTISPRSLAAGGAEVTERATGERSVRPLADVEAWLTGAGPAPAPTVAECEPGLGLLDGQGAHPHGDQLGGRRLAPGLGRHLTGGLGREISQGRPVEGADLRVVDRASVKQLGRLDQGADRDGLRIVDPADREGDLGRMAAAMPISETRYGEPLSRSAELARSWSEVALMITSARTFGSIRSIAVEIPRLAWPSPTLACLPAMSKVCLAFSWVDGSDSWAAAPSARRRPSSAA